MILSLCGYFDVGASYGLADDALSGVQQGPALGTATRTGIIMVPDIEGIGIRNPLGNGLTFALSDAVIARWREIAVAKVDNPKMELGFADNDPDAEQHKANLKTLALTHPLSSEITVYAVGTSYIRLDIHDGVPLHLARGLGKCFEYAAYSKPIATEIHRIAKAAVEQTGVDRLAAMQSLSQRPLPKVRRDERGVEEWLIIPSFTYVVRRTDPSESLDAIMKVVVPLVYDPVLFEYHGTLYFNWAACVLDPRSFDDPDEDALALMERMMWCIKIAHSFLATCEAFENLTLNETLSHADSYIKGRTHGGRGRDLNRLRTLALAVHSMTRYEQVTPTAEDQRYFELWERHARIANRNEIIFNRCEVLYNVQEAERQAQENRRSRQLNDILFTLTAITLIGFLTGAYDFIRDEEQWLETVLQRLVVLIVLALILYGVSRVILRHGHNTR